ncbi:MAG: Gfo/Idh/MocA family oxidoreductase [Bacteroidales bacterium]|jgi:predicted dehydrogenase|nr:Gfo/Idh/MocA family oxidoreductase [Bacteroidales bacterium]
MKKYKWGILTAGKMSAKFVRALKLLHNAELYAVGARDISRAKLFAGEHGIKKYYGSYEELAADTDVDIIYIASPHASHFEHTMLCLKNRKAVLCEKAFALDTAEAAAMIEEAHRQNVFLMDALWPPFQPVYRQTKDLLLKGEIGRLIHIDARFGFQAPYDAADRKFNLMLGGGSLLDIGIYPVNDILYFMGTPDSVTAKATFAGSGAEHSINIIFGFNSGQTASVFSSFRVSAGIECTLYGENGNLVFSRGRDMSQRLTLAVNGKKPEEHSFIPEGMGYHYEAAEVMRCLDEGKTESPAVPHSYSLALMNILDRVRSEAGIVFPKQRPS